MDDLLRLRLRLLTLETNHVSSIVSTISLNEFGTCLPVSLRDWATNNQNCEDAILMDQSYTFSIVMEKPMVLVAWVVPWNTTYDYLYKPSFLDICYKCLTKMYVMVEFFGWNHLQQGIHINIPLSRYFFEGRGNSKPIWNFLQI